MIKALVIAAISILLVGCTNSTAAVSTTGTTDQEDTVTTIVASSQNTDTDDSLYSDWDLEQSLDLSKATEITVSDNQNVSITWQESMSSAAQLPI